MNEEQRVKELLAAVLGVDASSIDETSTIETIPSWDSMAVLSISLAVEEEFEFMLTPEEQLEMGSYQRILQLVKGK